MKFQNNLMEEWKMTLRTEKVEVAFNVTLKKHLDENEVICPGCKGSALQVGDQPFGIKGENHPSGHMFPYKKQSIISCQDCYNGVQQKCEYCSKLLGRQGYCNCEGYEAQRSNIQSAKEQKRWENTTRVFVEEFLKENDDNMLYLDNYDQFFDDIDGIIEFLQDKIDEEELEVDAIPYMRVYRTNPVAVSFDASSIFENVGGDLPENAYDNLESYRKEFQTLLDTFANKIEKDTLSYEIDSTRGILLKPSDFSQ